MSEEMEKTPVVRAENAPVVTASQLPARLHADEEPTIEKAKEKDKNLDTKKYFEEAAKKDMYIADCNYLEGQINYRMKDYQKAVDGFFDSFEDMKAIRYYALSDFATLAYFANEGLKGTNPKQYDKNLKKFEAAGIKMKR